MAIGKDSAILQITIKKETKERLEKIANSDCRSVSNLINKLISDYLAEYEEESK
jgi:predicted transcriptional regulator